MKKISYYCDFCKQKIENEDDVPAFMVGRMNCLDEFVPTEEQPHHFHRGCLFNALHGEADFEEREEEEEKPALPKSREEQDQLILDKYNNGESYAAIGRAVGLAYPTIKNRLQKMGVEIL